MFFILLLISLSHSLIPTNKTLTIISQFELKMYFNQYFHVPLIIHTIYNNKSEQTKQIRRMINQAKQMQPKYAIDGQIFCDSFIQNLNNTFKLCQNQIQNKKNSIFMWKPKQTKLVVKGNQISDIHQQVNLQNELQKHKLGYILRQSLPDYLDYIQDEYDFNNFISSTLNKILFFQDTMRQNREIRKLACTFKNRIMVGITDQKSYLKKFNVQKINKLLILKYNFLQNNHSIIQYEPGIIQNDHIQYEKLYQFVIPFVRQYKKRNILLDFQFNYPTKEIKSQDHLLERIVQQEKFIVLEINNQHTSQTFNQYRKQYDNVFQFYHWNCNCTKYKQYKIPVILMFHQSLQPKHFNYGKKTGLSTLFPLHTYSSLEKFSDQKQAHECLQLGFRQRKVPIMIWPKVNSYQQFLLLYLRNMPSFHKAFQFCYAQYPDRKTIRRFNISEGKLIIYEKQKIFANNTQRLKQIVYQTQDFNFLDIKMFLRQSILNQFNHLLQQIFFSNITQIENQQQFKNNCQINQCILIFVNTQSSRHKKDMEILKKIRMQFHQKYNFLWIDALCHQYLMKLLKIERKQLTSLIYYNQKQFIYHKYDQSVYLNKMDVNRWIKKIRSKKIKFKKLKFSIDFENIKCKQKKEKKNRHQNQDL